MTAFKVQIWTNKKNSGQSYPLSCPLRAVNLVADANSLRIHEAVHKGVNKTTAYRKPGLKLSKVAGAVGLDVGLDGLMPSKTKQDVLVLWFAAAKLSCGATYRVVGLLGTIADADEFIAKIENLKRQFSVQERS
jgi:hypothetical protein